MALLIPFAAGGCPEFQNSVVEALSGATQAILLTDTDQQDAIDAAATSIASAAIDLFFSQFRSHQASR
ncbi:MAG: hypothetical protein HZB38_10280 [Planctomycetes bacterium]|nr:hypothetical protein [Planctomycetota bacterium]